MSSSPDVLIVGAGIGGAVLALALGKQGWRIKVLEREPQPIVIARPEVLWGATPAALDRFGIGDLVRREASVRVTGIVATHGGKRLVTISQEELERAGVEPYSTDPALTREQIVAAAQATGQVEFVRGAEVKELIRDGDTVCGVCGTRGGEPFEERAQLVVGDDGGRSVVRQGLGIPLATKIFPFDFVTATIPWPDGLADDLVRLWFDPPSLRDGIPAAAFIPKPGRLGTLLMPLSHGFVEKLFAGAPEDFWSLLARTTPAADDLRTQVRFPAGFRHISRPYGHAPRYVADGAAILGDAAHPVSPAGGQGANASIWDALALAEVAHGALKAGDVSAARLARYETLRRQRNEASVNVTRWAVRGLGLLRCLPGLPALVPILTGLFDSQSWLKRRMLRTFATTFVTR